jgi:hypothetical protein
MSFILLKKKSTKWLIMRQNNKWLNPKYNYTKKENHFKYFVCLCNKYSCYIGQKKRGLVVEIMVYHVWNFSCAVGIIYFKKNKTMREK